MKERIDPLSDAIFSIIMTILVLKIHVPDLHGEAITNAHLYEELVHTIPNFIIFFFSFAVLGSYWISHNIILSVFAKNVDRMLAMINFAFLAIAGLVPFSAGILASNPNSRVAIILYSTNIFVLTVFLTIIRLYIFYSPSIQINESVTTAFSPIDRIYANMRIIINFGATILAVLSSFIYTPLSIFFLTIPVFYSLIPGLLAKTLKLFGIPKKS